MKKKPVKILSVLIAALVAFSCTACNNNSTSSNSSGAISADSTEAQSQYPDYLNLDSTYPIVKPDSSEKVTLSVLTGRASTNATTDVNGLWWFQYMEQKMNVKFNLEETQDTDTRISLMFASNQLPDIIMGIALSPEDTVTYGVNEDMILPWNDYLNAELMPNAYAVMSDYSDAWLASTCLDGNIYTLPKINEETKYSVIPTNMRVFVNQNWLDACNLENPTTLDGFVDMLRTFKSQDPMKLGDQNIPLVSNGTLFAYYLWNALGFYGGNFDDCGLQAMLKDNQIVVPCGSEEYTEFVTVMHTMYTEGLISPDYLTMDKTTARALMAANNCGVMADWAPYLSVPDSFSDWISVKPLSSDYSQNTVASTPANYIVGNFYSSAETKYPEVIARLADYLYTDEGAVLFDNGPMAGSEDTLDLIGGWLYDADGNLTAVEVQNQTVGSYFEYQYQYGQVCQNTCGNYVNDTSTMQKMAGLEPFKTELNWDDPDDNYTLTLAKEWDGHIVNTQLPTVYLSSEDLQKVTDLKSVISTYVQSETAKFIVGTRPLDELDDYYSELDALGFKDYQDIYVNAYADFIKSLK